MSRVRLKMLDGTLRRFTNFPLTPAPLMEPLAIRLGYQKPIAKSLTIPGGARGSLSLLPSGEKGRG